MRDLSTNGVSISLAEFLRILCPILFLAHVRKKSTGRISEDVVHGYSPSEVSEDPVFDL